MESMSTDATFAILHVLKESISDISSLTEAFLRAGHGASYGKLMATYATVRKRKKQRAYEVKTMREERHRFASLLYRLKKQGFIEPCEKGEAQAFRITAKGSRKLHALQEARSYPNPTYAMSKGEKVVLVMYDVPEIEKKKRAWLRSALKHLDFKMIQKSVWIGKTRIPQRFIEDMHQIALTKYVEILEITKRGSLKKLL